MKGRIFLTITGCILLAASYSSAMADESAVNSQEGKVIIKSVPLKCEVSFLDRTMSKVKDLVIVEEVPAGKHAIVFKRGDETLKAEFDVEPGDTLLVNAHFRRNRVLVTPRVFVGKDGAPMVLIPAGEFQMGSTSGEPDEEPVHTVYLDAFYMDIYEVTNEIYREFMDATGHKPPRYWGDPKHNATDQPVVGITWHDAKAYCEWAGKRLPMEAEWEKAARGGLVGKEYPWGDSIAHDGLDDSALGTQMEASAATPGGLSPVGSIAPNGYGLHDMAGNAWEWCADWYDEEYYASSPIRSPIGPNSGQARVLRGGSWPAGVYAPLRVAYRYSYNPAQTSDLIGFRCVKMLH